MPLLCWYYVASVIREALLGRGGGYLFPCSSEINCLIPLFPQNLFAYVLCSPILSLFPSKFGLSSSVPLKKMPLFLVQQNPCKGLICTRLIDQPGLEVIKLEYKLRLKIKRNDWLLADTCPQTANHCALF